MCNEIPTEDYRIGSVTNKDKTMGENVLSEQMVKSHPKYEISAQKCTQEKFIASWKILSRKIGNYTQTGDNFLN